MVTPSPIPFQPNALNQGFKAHSLDAFLNLTYPATDDLIEGVLGVGGRLVALALKGVGKTLYVTQMALELASATPHLGVWQIKRPVRVMILQKELPDWQFQDRLAQAAMQYPHLNEDNLILPKLEDIVDLRLDNPHGLQVLEQSIIYHKPEVIVLDPFRHFHMVNEDKELFIKPMLLFLNKMIEKYKVAFIVSHHLHAPMKDFRSGKRVAQDMYDMSGSKFLIEWADTVFTLNQDPQMKVLMTPYMRYGKEPPINIVMELDRQYATFDGEVQDLPTTDAEWKAANILGAHNDEMLFNDLISGLISQGVNKTVANVSVNTMIRKHLLYFVGSYAGTSNRLLRMLSPQTRTWFH